MNLKDIPYLVQLIATNDCEASFKRFFKHYYSGLLHFAIGILHDKGLAEEVVDDVFVKVWTNRKMLPTIGNITYYLYTATKHTAINYLQKKQKSRIIDIIEAENELDIISHTPEDSAIQNENMQIIEAAINTLPHKCRLIFRLVKEDGLKYREVAELTNLSVKTIEAHMTLAYSRLVESLDKILSDTNSHNKRLKKS